MYLVQKICHNHNGIHRHPQTDASSGQRTLNTRNPPPSPHCLHVVVNGCLFVPAAWDQIKICEWDGGTATQVTASRSWAGGRGGRRGTPGAAGGRGAEVRNALRQLLLQLFLEADGQDGEHSEYAEHGQRVPGHCLARRGQLVQRCPSVDGYEGRRGHSCGSAGGNAEESMTTQGTRTWHGPLEEVDGLTKKGTNEENPQRHIDDGWGDVDEPVGKKGGDPQEDDVVD